MSDVNMLLLRRRAMMMQNSKPYDSKVEYLENDGTQYIDTGIYLDLSSDFEIGFTAQGQGRWGWVHQDYAWGTWIASRNSDNFSLWYGVYSKKITASALTGSYDVKITKTKLLLNNTQYNISNFTAGADSIENNSLKFFLWYNFKTNSIETGTMSSRFESFYIKIDGVLVRDFIPVRVGQVGYMYDQVSGQLFGNMGTGSFILGPDVI